MAKPELGSEAERVEHLRCMLASNATGEVDVLRNTRPRVAKLVGDLSGAEACLIHERGCRLAKRM